MRTESFPSIEGEPKQNLEQETAPQEEEKIIIEEARNFEDLNHILEKQGIFEGQTYFYLKDHLNGLQEAAIALHKHGIAVDNLDPILFKPIPEGLHETVKRLLKHLIEGK